MAAVYIVSPQRQPVGGLRPRLPVAAEDFADPSVRERWVRERNLEVFSLHDPANPLLQVGLFAVNPIPFEELWARAEVVQLETLRVPVVSIADLIRMQKLADRPRSGLLIRAAACLLPTARGRAVTTDTAERGRRRLA